jgi:hypothetical protein
MVKALNANSEINAINYPFTVFDPMDRNEISSIGAKSFWFRLWNKILTFKDFIDLILPSLDHVGLWNLK